MKTVGVYVDVSNLYYCVGKAFPGKKVDYQKYLDAAAGENAIYKAKAFGIQNNPDHIKFVACLKHLGYDPKFKKFDPKNNRINSNMLIAVELFRTIDKLDVVVLGSADANLADLIYWAKDRGVDVHILACGISHYLKEAANGFTEITEDLLEQPPEVKDADTDATQ